jgi:transmembrane sensor
VSQHLTQLPDDLLARYVAGETTPDEAAQVKAWLTAATDHAAAERELLRYQKIWEQSTATKPQTTVNTDAAWEKVKAAVSSKQFTAGSEQSADINRPFKVSFGDYWRAAASILVVIGLGWLGYLWLNQQPSKPLIAKVLESKNQTTEHLLPDGTKVFLNQNTQLTVAADFNQTSRSVTLKGEAYFEVKRDEQKPFVIQVNGSEVKVLGTTFNVKAYGPTVSVTVTSGKVQLAKKNAKTLLVKGEAAAVQADTIVRLRAVNPNALAYHTRVFVFEKTDLESVVASLREGYHADIQLRHRNIAHCRLTARFERESLDNTLAVIAETLQLKVIRQGDQIILDGEGCQ